MEESIDNFFSNNWPFQQYDHWLGISDDAVNIYIRIFCLVSECLLKMLQVSKIICISQCNLNVPKRLDKNAGTYAENFSLKK